MVQAALRNVDGHVSLEQVRKEWVTKHTPEGSTPAFGSPPFGLTASQVVHTLLPPLGDDPEEAQRIVLHAYRNIFEVLCERDDRYLALPVLGAESCRETLPVRPFVQALFAAVVAFGQNLSEVYLCPHSREVGEAIKQELLEAMRGWSEDDVVDLSLIHI